MEAKDNHVLKSIHVPMKQIQFGVEDETLPAKTNQTRASKQHIQY